MITIIKKNSALLLFMISDILDLGRINKGELKINISKFDIDQLIDDVMQLLEIQYEQKGIKLLKNIKIKNKVINSDP